MVTSPVIDNIGNIYFGTSEGHIISLNSNGEQRWKYTIPDAYERNYCCSGNDYWYKQGAMYDVNINFAPAISGSGVVYIGTSGQLNEDKIYAIESQNGNLVWTKSIDGPIQSEIKIYNDEVLYFTTSTTLYSINLSTKEEKSYSIIGTSNSPAVSNDGSIFVCSENSLIKLNQSFNDIWKYKLNSDVQLNYCDPAINPENGEIYFTAIGLNKIYALNSDGTEKWNSIIFGTESAPSVGLDGTVYIGTSDSSMTNIGCEPYEEGGGVFFAFNPDGTEKWRYYVPPVLGCRTGEECADGDVAPVDCYDNSRAIDGASIVGSDGTIYFGTDAKLFIALNPDGTKKWTYYDPEEFDRKPAIAQDGTLYIAHAGGPYGGLIAINDDGASVGSEYEASYKSFNCNDTGRSNETGQECFVGNEEGVTCNEIDACSSNELVDGCCINGECLN